MGIVRLFGFLFLVGVVAVATVILIGAFKKTDFRTLDYTLKEIKESEQIIQNPSKTLMLPIKEFPAPSRKIFYFFRNKALEKMKNSKNLLELWIASCIAATGTALAILLTFFFPPIVYFLPIPFLIVFTAKITYNLIFKKKEKELPVSKIARIIASRYPPSIIKKLKGTNLYNSIIDLLSLLVEYDTPASIYHHAPEKGGLRNHTIRVAQISLKLLKNKRKEIKPIDAGLIYLMALAHDIGKIRVYIPKPKEKKKKLPTPLEYERKNPEDEAEFSSFKISDTTHSKMILNEILLRNNFSEREREGIIFALFENHKETQISETSQNLIELAELVKVADQLAVSEELKEVKHKKILYDAFLSAIKNMNVNSIFGSELDGWYDPKRELLFLILWKTCNNVSKYILEENPEVAPYVSAFIKKWIETPPIWYKLREIFREKGLIPEYIQQDGEKIPTYDGIVNLKADKITFQNVIILDASKIPEEIKAPWKDPRWAKIMKLRVIHPREQIVKEICQKLNIKYSYHYTNFLSPLLSVIQKNENKEKLINEAIQETLNFIEGKNLKQQEIIEKFKDFVEKRLES